MRLTGVNGQLGHDVVNDLIKRGHVAIGSDITDVYSGIADASAITNTDYIRLDIDKQMQFMLRYLKSDYGHDLLIDSVKEALQSSTYEIESDDEVTDQELLDALFVMNDASV